MEAEQHHRSVDVPSETPKEAPDNLEMVVEGPARGNSPEVTGDSPSQTDKSVTKASFSSSQEKKGSEAIPDLTRQPAEEEEGDGEGPACVLQLSSLASLKLSVSNVLCLQYTYIGNVLCLQYTYIGNVLCLQYTYIGNVLCLQYTYIGNVLCLQYTLYLYYAYNIRIYIAHVLCLQEYLTHLTTLMCFSFPATVDLYKEAVDLLSSPDYYDRQRCRAQTTLGAVLLPGYSHSCIGTWWAFLYIVYTNICNKRLVNCVQFVHLYLI